MSNFVNTIDLLGDEMASKSIIERTITEFNDDIVTKVGKYCFRNCPELTSVDLPNVVELGDNAFGNCPELTSANIPYAKKLGEWAFVSCSKLKEAIFPCVEGYINSTFQGCYELKIADLRVNRLNSNAFMNCSSLATLILRNKTVCAIGYTNALSGTPFASGGTGGTVYVPQALITEYQNATNWSTLYAGGTCNFVAIEGSEYE